MQPLVKVGVAFAASGLLTYLVGGALLARRDARPQDDSHMRERVRNRVAELVSYPEAIDVQVYGSLVRLKGHVLATELDGLLSQLTQVPQVHKVYNALVSVNDPAVLVRDAISVDGPVSR